MLGCDRLLWTRDGKEGPDDPNTSMSILLKWLTAEGNYTKYRGGPTSHGKGKQHWVSILSHEIKEAGVRKYRSPKAIRNKINTIEETFKSAHDWAGQTGAGVKENDPRHFKDYVLKKCPYYFDLLDVMQDRSTYRPKVTSDALDLNSVDDGSSYDSNILPDKRLFNDNDDDDDDNDDEEETTTKPNHKCIPSTPSTRKRSTNSPPPGSVTLSAKKQPKADTSVASVIHLQQEAIAEATRHNKQMEQFKKWEIESFEQELVHKANIARLKEQEMELSHRLALVDAYDRVKGKISDEMIRKKFPELAEFIDSDK